MVVLIIDADTPTGAEHARRLGLPGASLALHHGPAPTIEVQTQRLHDELTETGVTVTTHVKDLRTAAAARQLIAVVRAEHQKIDLVVNAAGLVLKKPSSTLTPSEEAEHDERLAYAVFVDQQRRLWTERYHASREQVVG